MFDKLMQALNYKTKRNKWDKEEITYDLGAIAIVSIIIYAIVKLS